VNPIAIETRNITCPSSVAVSARARTPLRAAKSVRVSSI
jgi:hypothetical protein